MKKVVRLTESQLVSVISEVISEGNVNEQGLRSLASRVAKAFSPDVKTVGSRSIQSLHSSGAPQSIKNLLTKFSVVKATNFVKEVLRPVENELMIVANDMKRIQPFAVPVPKGEYDFFSFLKGQIGRTQEVFRPINNVYNLDQMYVELKTIRDLIDDVIKYKRVTKQGMGILNGMKTNADDALKNIEIAISQIAVK